MQLAFIYVDMVRAVHWFKDIHLTTRSIIFCTDSPFSKGGCRAAIIRIRPAITLVRIRVGFDHRREKAFAIFFPRPPPLFKGVPAKIGGFDRPGTRPRVFLPRKKFWGIPPNWPLWVAERRA